MMRRSKRKIKSVKLLEEAAGVTHLALVIYMDTLKPDSPLIRMGAVGVFDDQRDPD